MRVLGVIAEYNPFHKGHAWQLKEARRLSSADHVIVVMSSCFTQRGDAALLSPADRTRMALACGADAVFALPACWAVRDAEHFALGGISLLAGLGCDAISFGTEQTDLTQLWEAAQLLENPDDCFQITVQQHMQHGLPHPAALSAAAEGHTPGLGALLSSPNSTLAICYLRAMLRLGVQMDAYPIKRRGGYHDTSLTDTLPSATALRGAVLRGDWRGVDMGLPAEARDILHEAALRHRLHRPDALDAALLYRLRTMSADEYAQLPDLSEGIEYRLAEAASQCGTRETLLQTAKTRRYPYARLSRLATHALLGMTDELLTASPLPDAAWLLGFRNDAKALFAHIKQKGSLPMIGKAADFDRNAPWFAAELRTYDIWALGAGLPAGLGLQQGVVRV